LELDEEELTEDALARLFGYDDVMRNRLSELSCWQRTKPKIYALFDEPSSSTGAKVIVLSTFLTNFLTLHIFFAGCGWN
jgi:potassium voltage-gated channel Shaw-related subfamily C protein